MLDYADAAKRHWDDGGYLLADHRLANADHLFGLAAECALKAVMLPLGMELNPTGAPKDRRHGHIDRLWDEFGAFVSSRGGARYAALLNAHQNPFTGSWKVDQRYDAGAGCTPATVALHQQGAMAAKHCLDAAILDGLIA